MKKKTLISIIAVALVICVSIGGVLAYLTAKTDTITNTFTVGNVNLTLTETWNTDSNGDGTNDSWSAKIIPGKTYDKDPVVTVTDDSEDCWLFVKFDENNNPANYFDYTSTLTSANGWTQGNGTDIPANVWYRSVLASDTVKTWHLLDGDTITVNGNKVKAENMDAAAKAELAYTAYAVQKEGLDAKTAWSKLF